MRRFAAMYVLPESTEPSVLLDLTTVRYDAFLLLVPPRGIGFLAFAMLLPVPWVIFG
jgi:hypothetical protein